MFRQRNQRGAPRYVDGQLGDPTPAATFEYVHIPGSDADPVHRGSSVAESPSDGKRNERPQHDDTDKSSESTRAESLAEAIARLKQKR